MPRLLTLLCSIAARFLTAPVQADDAVSEKRIRDAIQKSIPYIESDGDHAKKRPQNATEGQ